MKSVLSNGASVSGLPNLRRHGQFSPGAPAQVRGRRVSAAEGGAKRGDQHPALRADSEGRGDDGKTDKGHPGAKGGPPFISSVFWRPQVRLGAPGVQRRERGETGDKGASARPTFRSVAISPEGRTPSGP